MNAPRADLAAVYQSAVTAYADPARLAVSARLLGFTPAPPAAARVLQIGEHVAANLVALAAANPDTHFVGLELGSGPVDITPLADELGLNNLRIEPWSVDRLGESAGERFNYVLCAGTFGRLTAAQRSALLRSAAGNLAADGVVCVGYLSLPGGHWHAALADMLTQHVSALADPAQRTAQARALLAFLAEANAEDAPYGKLLRQAKAQFELMSDQQINLEYLQPPSEPLSLTQVLQAAGAAGLAYLGDLDLPGMTDLGLPENARQRLAEAKGDPVRYEQYLDFVRGRAFRHTLLVGSHATANRTITPERLQALAVASALRPVADDIELTDGVRVDFRHPGGAVLPVTHAVTKAALAALGRSWPQAVPYAELLAGAVHDTRPANATAQRAVLATDLLGYFISGLIELRLAPLRLTTDIGALPHAWPLARLQARQASGPVAWVTNLRHENIPLDAVSREVLSRLDGRHDRGALLEHLHGAVRDGRLTVHSQSQPLTDRDRLDAALVEAFELALRRLAAAGVLITGR